MQSELIHNKIHAQTPEVPDGFDPNHEKCRTVFVRFKNDKYLSN